MKIFNIDKLNDTQDDGLIGRKPLLNTDQRNHVRKLYNDGHSVKRIAAAYDVHRQNIYRILGLGNKR